MKTYFTTEVDGLGEVDVTVDFTAKYEKMYGADRDGGRGIPAYELTVNSISARIKNQQVTDKDILQEIEIAIEDSGELDRAMGEAMEDSWN